MKTLTAQANCLSMLFIQQVDPITKAKMDRLLKEVELTIKRNFATEEDRFLTFPLNECTDEGVILDIATFLPRHFGLSPRTQQEQLLFRLTKRIRSTNTVSQTNNVLGFFEVLNLSITIFNKHIDFIDIILITNLIQNDVKSRNFHYRPPLNLQEAKAWALEDFNMVCKTKSDLLLQAVKPKIRIKCLVPQYVSDSISEYWETLFSYFKINSKIQLL